MSDKHLPSTQHILGPDFSNEVEILTFVSSFSWNRPIIVLVYTANDYLKFNISIIYLWKSEVFFPASDILGYISPKAFENVRYPT